MTRTAARIGLLLLGLALTVVAYLPALDAGFYFDDIPNILNSPGIHWDAVSAENFRALISSTQTAQRPVANLSLALNFLAGGLEPRGYHLANLLIHLAVGVALAWTCTLILGEGQVEAIGKGPETVAAVVAASLFLMHTLNSQTVIYVVQRMTSMAALFSLLALGCYLSGRRCGHSTAWAWYLAAVVFWLLGIGSKETALVLPLLIVTYEWCFHRGAWQPRLRRWRSTGWPARLTGVSVLILGTIIVLATLGAYVGEETFSFTRPYANRDFSGLERVLTQSRVQLLYLSLVVWPAPSRLNLDHELDPSHGLLEPPTTLIAVLIWLGVLAAAVWVARKRPRLGFPLLAYLELHLIESGPLNLELVFEHRMYLPMTALSILAAVTLTTLPPRQRRVAFVLALLALIPLTIATRARAATWADSIAFHYDCARKSPGKFRAQYNLGTELGQRGRIEEAIAPLERALQLNPEDSGVHNQLANTYLMTSRPLEAMVHYREAVRLDPNNVEAVYNLAKLLDDSGALDEAAQHYRRFIEIAPTSLSGHVQRVRQRLQYLAQQETPPEPGLSP